MASGGDESPPPPPHPPAVASSEEEEEEGEAGVAAPRALSPTPQTLQRFEELCCRLNMDETARAEAWDSYRSMSDSYTLEVRLRGVGGLEGREARVFPGRAVGASVGMGLLLTPDRATRTDSPTGPGVGRNPLCAPQSWTPGFPKAPSGPEGDSRTPAVPVGVRVGNTCCPRAALLG